MSMVRIPLLSFSLHANRSYMLTQRSTKRDLAVQSSLGQANRAPFSQHSHRLLTSPSPPLRLVGQPSNMPQRLQLRLPLAHLPELSTSQARSSLAPAPVLARAATALVPAATTLKARPPPNDAKSCSHAKSIRKKKSFSGSSKISLKKPRSSSNGPIRSMLL